ncbi:MAG: VanW family protein [Clostridia bacterium]|nr:VanW family protein [Clostridia bacterium]
MRKTIIYIIVATVVIGIVVFAVQYFSGNKQDSSNNPQPQRISSETNISSEANSSTPFAQIQNSTESAESKQPAETEISSFSTKILVDDDNRDTNLEITASKINGTIVKNGEEFSFNKVVGNPTEEKGYEKAGAFGANGKKIKTNGGGNCQVSSTLYDAVLKVDGLKVTERHQHEREVGYVELGKDATVAYDYLDFKFKNNTGYDIKLYASVTEEKVEVKIMKITK